MSKRISKSGLFFIGVVGLGILGGLALATAVFSDDFSAPTLSAYTAGCERANAFGDSCSSNLDTAIFQSAPQSAHLLGHGSCRRSPFDGVASTLSRTILLGNGNYLLKYKARHTTTLYDFCEGGTGGSTFVSVNGVSGAGVGCSIGGSCSSCTADWADRSVCFPVTSGSADLKIVASAGDCDNADGWVDDITIESVAPPVFDAASLVPQTLLGNCAGGSLAFAIPTATSICGAVTVSCSSLDASNFGSQTVNCTATDPLGATSNVTLTVNVLEPLRVVFNPPLSDDNVADDVRTDADNVNSFRVGQTIVHKVTLLDCHDSDVTTTRAVAVKLAVAPGETGVSDGGASLISDTGDFEGVGSTDGRMILTEDKYHFNLKTSAAKYPSMTLFQALIIVAYTEAPTIIVGQEDARLGSR